MENVKKCSADENTVHEACWALSEQADFSTAKKGIVSWPFLNIKTGKQSRLLYGSKSKAYPDGLIFNFCPFCGEKHPGAYQDEAEDEALATPDTQHDTE